MFVQQMMEALANDPETFKTDFEVLKEELAKQAGDKSRSHLSAVATVILGDYYSSKWIFGIDEDESFAQAMSLAETILAQLEAATDMDDATRAMEWVRSWVEQHRPKFQNESSERFGWIE